MKIHFHLHDFSSPPISLPWKGTRDHFSSPQDSLKLRNFLGSETLLFFPSTSLFNRKIYEEHFSKLSLFFFLLFPQTDLLFSLPLEILKIKCHGLSSA